MAEIKIPELLFYELCWITNVIDKSKLPLQQAAALERCQEGLQKKLATHQARLDYSAEIEKKRSR